MDAQAIKQKLARLAERDWPSEWDDKAAREIGDFFGWSHRYKLAEPLAQAEIKSFEEEHRVSLPGEYREFLTEIGNGGAGPGYGIEPLGELDGEKLPEDILQNLSREFKLSEAWNDTSLLDTPEIYYGYELLAGAMPIASTGCSIDYWIVVSEPKAGQIWLDKRTDNEGIVPITDDQSEFLSFRLWYEEWLDGAWVNYQAR